MNPSDAVIRLEALNVVAGGRGLLTDVTLLVRAKERIAVIGANGAGKTTLLKTLTGMMLPSSGSVEVLGRQLSGAIAPVELRQLRSRIGQVFQGLHLVGRLSALENVLIGALGRSQSLLTCARLFSVEERDLAQAALEAVGMGHVAAFRVDRLSGGERQKVAIARALNQDPELILADEPTANLDPIAAGEVADLLTRIAGERKVTLITVAHTLSLLPNLAQRVVGLKSGRIVFDEVIDAIDQRQLQQLYRSDEGMAVAPRASAGPNRVMIP
jgi:phosphonate transport system ATP-binding protein